MHRLRALVLLVTVAPAVARAAPASPIGAAVWWQPHDAGERADRVAAAFRRALEQRGARVLTVEDTPPSPRALAPSLMTAIEAWRAARFDDAVRALSDLQLWAEQAGGGELDARQLSDLFLHRGLARLELGQNDAAWEDFVRAARLDPTRALDPAQYPPRAVAAYRRAAADAAQQPRATLTLEVPAGARVRIDGRAASERAQVALGPHFVRVEAAGFRPWAGTLTVAAADEHAHPPLEPEPPPPAAALLARAAAAPTVVIATLSRTATGWSLAARRVDRATGRTTSEEAQLDPATAPEPTVESVAHALLDPAVAAPAPAPEGRRKRWWIWAAIGGAVGVAAIVIPIGVVYGTPPSRGEIGGNVPSLRGP